MCLPPNPSGFSQFPDLDSKLTGRNLTSAVGREESGEITSGPDEATESWSDLGRRDLWRTFAWDRVSLLELKPTLQFWLSCFNILLQ